MGIYLIFFGKSQDFTTYYYDRNNPIHDFNSVIKDFDLLESKIFTVDDIKNKEILSRYFFSAQGKNYCLLKLYSFAQAYSGNRIAGSIYGVGILSDKAINFSKINLELLRVAKDNFAKLSLDGYKFNKSNFEYDTDRIWKAIVSNNDGNLLDKIDVSPLKINGSGGAISFYVKDLKTDAIKLNERILNQDTVYLSEDLEHLKRTQNKWGKDAFPIYWEQNNQFVPYKEPVIEQKPHTSSGISTSELSNRLPNNDIAKLKVELEDSQYNNRNLKNDLESLRDKHRLFTYVIYGLSGLILLMLLFIIISWGRKKEVSITTPTPKEEPIHSVVHAPDPISVFLTDNRTVESGIVFLRSVQFIYAFDVKNNASDSTKFHKQFQSLQKTASDNHLDIKNITQIYTSKSKELKIIVSADKKTKTVEQKTKKPLSEKKQKKNPN